MTETPTRLIATIKRGPYGLWFVRLDPIEQIAAFVEGE